MQQVHTIAIWIASNLHYLTRKQYELLETDTRIAGLTIGEYITETILSFLECEVKDTIPHILKEKLAKEEGAEV